MATCMCRSSVALRPGGLDAGALLSAAVSKNFPASGNGASW